MYRYCLNYRVSSHRAPSSMAASGTAALVASAALCSLTGRLLQAWSPPQSHLLLHIQRTHQSARVNFSFEAHIKSLHQHLSRFNCTKIY